MRLTLPVEGVGKSVTPLRLWSGGRRTPHLGRSACHASGSALNKALCDELTDALGPIGGQRYQCPPFQENIKTPGGLITLFFVAYL